MTEEELVDLLKSRLISRTYDGFHGEKIVEIIWRDDKLNAEEKLLEICV